MINYFKNESFEFQKQMIHLNPLAIQHIKNPNINLCIMALRKSNASKEYIKLDMLDKIAKKHPELLI